MLSSVALRVILEMHCAKYSVGLKDLSFLLSPHSPSVGHMLVMYRSPVVAYLEFTSDNQYT